MRRRVQWALEDINVDTSAPTVPDIDNMGAQNGDGQAPEDGSLFSDDNRVQDDQTTDLNLPEPPHPEDTVASADDSVVPPVDNADGTQSTDTTDLHADDEAAKAEAAAAPDTDNNQPDYTPPPPAPEPAEPEETGEDALESEEEEEDTEEHEGTLDDSESSDDGLDDDGADEGETDSAEEEGADGEEDEGAEASEEESTGDNETVEVGDDLVETNERELDSEEAAEEKLDSAKDQLDDDKEELEKLKNVATEALQAGGLSLAGANLIRQRINKIHAYYNLRSEPIAQFAVEDFDSSINSFQNTNEIINLCNIAQEGLAERTKDWFKAKMNSVSSFFDTIGAYGNTAKKDAARKLEKINTLLPDWECGDIKVTKPMAAIDQPHDPLALARIMRKAAKLNFEAIAADAGKKGNPKSVKSLVGAHWEKTNDANANGLNGRGTVEVQRLLIAANSYIYDGVYEWPGGAYLPSCFAVSPTVEPTGTFKGLGLRELKEIVETYNELAEVIVKNESHLLQSSKAFKDADDALAEDFKTDLDNVLDTSKVSTWSQQLATVAVLLAHYRAIVNTCRALKAATDAYLKAAK